MDSGTRLSMSNQCCVNIKNQTLWGDMKNIEYLKDFDVETE